MGATLVVEHKTTSLEIGPGSPYWRRLLLDSQVSNYLVGAESLGMRADGVLYDVVRKVQLRPQRATPPDERQYTQARSRACPMCKKKGSPPAPHDVELTEDGEDGAPCTRILRCEAGRLVTDPGGRLYANQRAEDETPDEYRERVRAAIAEAPDAYYQRGTIVRLEREVADAARDMWELGRQIREAELAHRWPRNPDACDSYGSLCPYFDVCTGAARIDDVMRFRDAPSANEELDEAPVDRRRLPILSTSAAKVYRSCPRKYYYAYVLRRRSVEDAAALRFGTLLHLGLERWWQTVDLDAAFAAMREQYTRLTAAPLDAVRAEELLRGYHARWAGESYDVLAVEATFTAPLVNPDSGAPSKTWSLGGKIDAIAREIPRADAAE